MTEIIIKTKDLDITSYFYKCSFSVADIYLKTNDDKHRYFKKRKQASVDQGFYLSGNQIKLFDIRNKELIITETDAYILKSNIRNRNTKGKAHNINKKRGIL